MVLCLLMFFIISNAVSLRRDKSVLFFRIVIKTLLFTSFIAMNNLYINPLEKGIGIYSGLFNINALTQRFNIFIFLISGIILTLTSFYPRKVYVKEFYSSFYRLFLSKLSYNKNLVSNKNGERFHIIEYPLIIVFILGGFVNKLLHIESVSKLVYNKISYILLVIKHKLFYIEFVGKLVYNKIIFILLVIKCELSEILNYQIRNLITFTICIRFILYVFSEIFKFINIETNIVYYIFITFILITVLIKFTMSSDKLKCIINLFIKLLILLCFWFIVGYVWSEMCNIEPFFFICSFLCNYELEGFQYIDLGIPIHLKEMVNSAFESIDKQLNFNGNHPGGPNNILVFCKPDCDDPDEDLDSKICFSNISDKVNQYYSKCIWDIKYKYFNQLLCKNIIDKYNDIHCFKSNITIAKMNIYNSIVYKGQCGIGCYLPEFCNPSGNSLMDYLDMVSVYKLYLWEDYVLSKAKFYCENYDDLKSSHILPLTEIYQKYETAYNFWLNRQKANILYQMRSGYPAIDFTRMNVLYPEICRDAIWVKLHLILFNSFFSEFSPQAKVLYLFTYGKQLEDVPFLLKAYLYHKYMPHLLKLHSIQYGLEHECKNELDMLRTFNWNGVLIDMFYEQIKLLHPEADKLNWLNSCTGDNIGLNLSKNFAYGKHYINVHFNSLEHRAQWSTIDFNSQIRSNIPQDNIQHELRLSNTSKPLGLDLLKNFAYQKSKFNIILSN